MNWLHPVILLSVGGAAGTNARYWLSMWVQQAWDEKHPDVKFPLGTLVINLSGSFLLGVFAVLFLEKLPESYRPWLLLLGVGFCGGYTTFSTFAYENFRLVKAGAYGFALLNILVSVLASFALVSVAVALMENTVKK